MAEPGTRLDPDNRSSFRRRNVGWILPLLACLVVLAVVIPRDLSMEKQYTGDLRNRVVGARLIHDGRSPYFYKWRPGDGIRYYDPANFDSLRSSNITSTPFFHELLIPLSALPQATASKVWLILEYLLFLGSVVLAFSILRRWHDPLPSAAPAQVQILLLMSALFLLTASWQAHIALGQVYIVIPFLALLFVRSMLSAHRFWTALLTGVTGASLVLIKPNTVVFFIPFGLLALGQWWAIRRRRPGLGQRRYFRRRWLAACLIPPVLFGAWIAASPWQRVLWQDYREGMTDQIKMHQGLHPALQQNAPDPHFAQFEGIDQQAVARLEAQQPLNLFSENGNVFVLIQKLFHYKPSVTSLSVVAILIILALSIGYAIRIRRFYPADRSSQLPAGPARTFPTLIQAGIFGFCLYMITDVFSPVYRHQYYTVQWLCPLLLAAVLYYPALRKYYLLLFLGLLLNIVHLGFIKMGHTIGEYMMLVVLVILGFKSVDTRSVEPSRVFYTV